MEGRSKEGDLDLIIEGMIEGKSDMVLQLMTGQSRPFAKDIEEERWVRFLEDELVRLELCQVKPGWTPNSVPFGFKTLELLPLGRRLHLEGKSVKTLYEKQRKKERREELKTRLDIARNTVYLLVTVPGSIYAVLDVIINITKNYGVYEAIKTWVLS
jgi:hypothetical protein